MGFFSNFWNRMKRAVGTFGGVVKKVGSFVAQHHQPISMMLHGLGEATGNQRIKDLSALGLMASGFATASGYGKNYVGDFGAATQNPRPPG